MHRILLLLVFLLLKPTSASAQIVNTAPLFRDVRDKPWALMGKGEFDVQRGNTQLLVLSAQLATRAQWRAWELLLTGAHERATANNEQLGNRTFGHLRSRYWFNRMVQWETFGQLAQDRFRLLTARGLGGTGFRYVPFHIDYFEWSLSAAYMYEVEQLDGSVDFPDGITRKTSRGSFSSTARLDYQKITLRQTFFVQPALRDWLNFRVLHELDFAISVTKYLSVTWTLSQLRDSIAPSDVLPYDNRFKAGLQVDL